ncbi:MAG: YdcF family protein [Bacteroidales bacterium]|nr:YdcF family protein [Bacteroidales bacterium]
MNQENITQDEACKVFDYLYLRDDNQRVDAVLGFGHFDMKIPHTCGKLYQEGYAPKIIFTGGVGAGTADLKKKEAQVFRDELYAHFPDIPEEDLLIEDQSTNTGENIYFLKEMAFRQWPEHNFSKGVSSVMLVCNAARQRRTWLTWKKILPEVHAINCPPETAFKQEQELFRSKGRTLENLLLGEMERILNYPDKGFTVEEEVPQDVYSAYQVLKAEYKP